MGRFYFFLIYSYVGCCSLEFSPLLAMLNGQLLWSIYEWLQWDILLGSKCYRRYFWKPESQNFGIIFLFPSSKCYNFFSTTYDDCQKNNSHVGVWSRLFAFLVGQVTKVFTVGQGFCFSVLYNSHLWWWNF